MAAEGGLQLEPIANNNPPDNNNARQEADGKEKEDDAAKKPKVPAMTPEEYWKKKAKKYGWRQNTGNYARDHLVRCYPLFFS